MSTGETYGNVSEIVRVASLEGAKPGVPFILPWRMDANQDHLHKGLEECGCGFCPDDDQETTLGLVGWLP
jgi:hypothetical protein